MNDPPEISDIGSQSTSEGELKRVEFTVDEGGGDIEDVQVLSITVASSNQELVPDDSIRLSFSDGDSDADKGRLEITPTVGASGSSTITLTLSDGVDVVDGSFTFSVGSVNDPPTVSAIPDQELDEDGWIDSIAFTVDEGGGADEDAQVLQDIGFPALILIYFPMMILRLISMMMIQMRKAAFFRYGRWRMSREKRP